VCRSVVRVSFAVIFAAVQIILLTMKLFPAAFLVFAAFVAPVAAYDVPSLTPENYDELTADKTVL
jgi:hypothetical protein